jgi:hypothetical protein
MFSYDADSKVNACSMSSVVDPNLDGLRDT